MTKTNTTLLLGILTYCSIGLLGCERSQVATSSPHPASAAQSVVAKPEAPQVARIVFVGKEHACDCTRKTVDGAWAILSNALGMPATLPVDRLAIDTEADKVAPYQQMRPILALPAIYFLSGTNGVVDLLQGDVTSEQVASALNMSK